jgi:hypothetical protein
LLLETASQKLRHFQETTSYGKGMAIMAKGRMYFNNVGNVYRTRQLEVKNRMK